jgi:hypothetical protein
VRRRYKMAAIDLVATTNSDHVIVAPEHYVGTGGA